MTREHGFKRVIVPLLAVLVGANQAAAQFDLVITTTGATAAQQAQIDLAEQLWEETITGYQSGISITGVNIDLEFRELGGGVLGQAGPNAFTNQGGFRLSTAGSIDLDDDLGLGSIKDVTAHEIGHILGIGTLWTDNGVYVNGTGEYTGAFGLAAYKKEVEPRATFVPVELDGGGGTANAHWDDSGFFTHELMSGFLSGSNFLSNTTVESMRDLGFAVIVGAGDLTGVEGDVNQDGFLTTADIDDFVLGWLSETEGLNAVERTMLGDLNLDGRTYLDDFSILHDALQTNLGLAVSLDELLRGVPEPATLCLLGMASLGCLTRPSRRDVV